MSEKPLGYRAYGSIPHLPGSRLGPGDHHCHEGQSAICTKEARDRHDVIAVQEKLDGSCCSIARLSDGQLVALTRAGYRAETSPYYQHHLFARFVYENIVYFDFIERHERLCGEWLAQAHGTRYRLNHMPFVAFDIMRGNDRTPVLIVMERCAQANVPTPKLLSYGAPCSIEWAMKRLKESGHGALDEVEGAVWRVERKGKVEFLAKYVRPTKQDGIYLESTTGSGPVWNEGLEEWLGEIAA
jgi:hypothetical protein